MKRYFLITGVALLAGCGSPSVFDAFAGQYGDVRMSLEVARTGEEPTTVLSDELLVSLLGISVIPVQVPAQGEPLVVEGVQVVLPDPRVSCVLKTSSTSIGTALHFSNGDGQCTLAEAGLKLVVTSGTASPSADRSLLRFYLKGNYEGDNGPEGTFTATIVANRM